MKKPLAHVLAVEDNVALADLMRPVLELVGIELTVAGSGGQAMELLRQRRFDLILLNIRLPDMSGFELCERLKLDPELKAIPVIFASGETDPYFKDEALRLGAVDYLPKPYRLRDFQAAVLAQLPQPGSQDQPADPGPPVEQP